MKKPLLAFRIRLVRFTRLALAAILLASALFVPGSTRSAQASSQIDIHGPAGSGAFGANAVVLPNGNFVVTDPLFDLPGPIADVGAVYLYNGASGALISTLTGSTAGDQVGEKGVTVLKNGNFVVVSPNWDSATAVDAGAVTWGSATSGVSGAVSAANSLVGVSAGDQAGLCDFSTCLTALTNGNFVVVSSKWLDSQNPEMGLSGAVTWGNGATGVSGPVSAANSLVGTYSQLMDADFIPVVEVGNGNYLVLNPFWNGGVGYYNVGAVTWGNGTTGVKGEVSAANSLVGSTNGDALGYCYVENQQCITVLSNGNYLVASPDWNNGDATAAGAVTWGSGASGVAGEVSVANSLVGSTTSDNVGDCSYSPCITELANGNYLVRSDNWANGDAAAAGAVTWGSGTSGVKGEVSPANSLVGSTINDKVGTSGIKELSNGNYVVMSDYWTNGSAAFAGAATWGNGATGISGVVSEDNSLVGSTPYDFVSSISALSNGNYVVKSPWWDNGPAEDVGAVTWGNGTSGVKGVVSADNSLVGSTTGDFIGSGDVMALNNGNYVVMSYQWHHGSAVFAGAATWGNGTIGVKGEVSADNSLVGSVAYDNIGSGGGMALSNGNYVVGSSSWHNGPVVGAGEVTWGNGAVGVSGVVSPANSLVGSSTNDSIGEWATTLKNGNFVVVSPHWKNGSAASAGAVTWVNGATGMTGEVSAGNSLVGSSTDDYIGACAEIRYCFTELSNGNYVVISSLWNNGPAAAGAGAVTWGSGATGVSGVVSVSNSLVGSTAGDSVGNNLRYPMVAPLKNGSYLVWSTYWDNGKVADAGAVTWANGATGLSGVVSAANSLVGSTANDYAGCSQASGGYCDSIGLVMLDSDHFVVWSPNWDNGPAANAGAVTPGLAAGCAAGLSAGPIFAANSVIGTAAGGGLAMTFAYDSVHQQLVVGRPADNTVSLFKGGGCNYPYHVYAPRIVK